MMPIAIIRLKELTTTTALTPSGFGTHDELPPLREENGKSNPNAFALDEERRRKKSFTANASKKKHPKISTFKPAKSAHFYSAADRLPSHPPHVPRRGQIIKASSAALALSAFEREIPRPAGAR
jgi:hypothetical protein